jgi:hypothetical protein
MSRAVHPFAVTLVAVALHTLVGFASAQPQWSITPPIVKESKPAPSESAKNVTPTPLRKEEARAKEEFARLTIERIFVEGSAEDARRKAREKEERFASALNRGNPEVPGGKVRHGAYYDGIIYWGVDPLSFLWLNAVTRFKE